MSLQDILSVVPSGSHEETLARQVNFDRLPQHVAVIMDGNGRSPASTRSGTSSKRRRGSASRC
jgi:undecaprenyl pyrophosphate synthase